MSELPTTSATAPAAALTDVCVSLGGAFVLSGVSVQVGRGEAVALMGANGSGKSTLIRALLGLVPSRGDISLFGTPRTRFRDWSRIGYVPQRSSGSLAIATVREVVASGRLPTRTPLFPASAADRRAIDAALDRVGLAGRGRDEMPNLSGGQQQRVLIARALAGSPDLMILDEPMAGVDLTTQDQLTDVMRGLKDDGMAMLVVLHELGPLSALMDRAIVLRDGQVVHDGPPPVHHEDGHEHVEEPRRRALLDGAVDGRHSA
ncbi:metal ABC transporter ATP-binding protein [Mariniluteicoccus flavus]